MQQVAELIPVPGVDLVGPLPGDLQKIIVCATGIPAKAKNPEAAKALAKFLASEPAVAVIKQRAWTPDNPLFASPLLPERRS